MSEAIPQNYFFFHRKSGRTAEARAPNPAFRGLRPTLLQFSKVTLDGNHRNYKPTHIKSQAADLMEQVGSRRPNSSGFVKFNFLMASAASFHVPPDFMTGAESRPAFLGSQPQVQSAKVGGAA